MIVRLTGIMLLLSILGGCRETEVSPPRLQTTSIKLGQEDFKIEIARTDADRIQGLSDREALPPGRGMIFVFDREEPRAFWMKNVPFPLDIVFLDASGRVVDIKRMLPLDLRQTRGARPAKYAIEIPAGAAARAGLKIGDVISIPAEAREPAQ